MFLVYRIKIFFGKFEINKDQKIKGLSKYGEFKVSLNENPKEEDFVNIEVIVCNDEKRKFNLNIDLYGDIYESIRKNIFIIYFI